MIRRKAGLEEWVEYLSTEAEPLVTLEQEFV